jgi:hypothetical protein
MLLEALEAGEFEENLVIADGQRREHEATIAIRQPFAPASAGHMKATTLAPGSTPPLRP